MEESVHVPVQSYVTERIVECNLLLETTQFGTESESNDQATATNGLDTDGSETKDGPRLAYNSASDATMDTSTAPSRPTAPYATQPIYQSPRQFPVFDES